MNMSRTEYLEDLIKQGLIQSVIGLSLEPGDGPMAHIGNDAFYFLGYTGEDYDTLKDLRHDFDDNALAHEIAEALIDLNASDKTDDEDIDPEVGYCIAYLEEHVYRFFHKWNRETREYEPYPVPYGWKLCNFSEDMNEIVHCAQCGKPEPYGNCFTSFEVQTEGGMGYCVCKDCHDKELARELKFKESYVIRDRIQNDSATDEDITQALDNLKFTDTMLWLLAKETNAFLNAIIDVAQKDSDDADTKLEQQFDTLLGAAYAYGLRSDPHLKDSQIRQLLKRLFTRRNV